MKKYIVGGVLGFVALLFLASSAVSVDVGERVVVVGFGEIKETLSEGFHFVNPLYNTHKFTIRNTKYETQATSGTSDIQNALVDVAVNFQINEDQVAEIYKTYGNDYMAQIFRQNVQEAVKSTTSQYTASQLITKREEVKDEVKAKLQEMVVEVVTVTDVAITNIEFSASFNDAIEKKVRAEQEALQAKAVLEKSKLESEAIRIQAEAIQTQGGSEYIKLKWIEAWREGGAQVPQFISGDDSSNFMINTN